MQTAYIVPKNQGFFLRHKAGYNMMVYLQGVPMLGLLEREAMQCLFSKNVWRRLAWMNNWYVDYITAF